MLYPVLVNSVCKKVEALVKILLFFQLNDLFTLKIELNKFGK